MSTSFSFVEYQAAALSTWSAAGDDGDLAYLALGLNGEAGEVAEHVKKLLRHGKDIDTKEIGRELGDLLWYVAVFAHMLDLDLAEVAVANIEKLRARYPDGFRARWGNNGR